MILLPEDLQPSAKITSAPPLVPRGLLTFALLVIITWGVAAARDFLIPLCLAALLASLMTPLVRTLARSLHVPEGVAIVLSVLILVLPLLGFGFLCLKQAQGLVQDFPTIENSVSQWLAALAAKPWAERWHLSTELAPDALINRLGTSAGQGIQFLIGGLRAVLNATSQLTVILLFAVVMVASRKHLRQSGEQLLGQFENIESARMLDAVSSLVEQFLLARLFIVLLVGVVAVGILAAFGIKYALLMGAFAGIMTLVPAVGFLIALFPPVVVAFATGHSLVATLGMLTSLIVLNLIEGNLITPRLMGRQLNINVLATFVGFLAGSLLWGIWGMLLSVPVLGVFRIIFSATPVLQPWGNLLAEREDKALSLSLIRRRKALVEI